MRFEPERAGGGGRIKAGLLPPYRFVVAAMDFAMMAAAERHGELIAGLSTERLLLGKAQMMRIGGRTAANQTRLLGHEPHVLTIAKPTRLGMR